MKATCRSGSDGRAYSCIVPGQIGDLGTLRQDTPDMKLRNILIAAMGLTMAAGAVSTASAATPWQDHHPRRAEDSPRPVAADR